MAHRGQVYGGPTEELSIDYISHIGSVAMEVVWALPASPHYDGNLAVQCALLHDVIEDTAKTYADVLQEFGQDVANGVRSLSKDRTIGDPPKQMVDSLHRIRQQPREIWMVKLADRIANLHYPPHSWQPERIRAYAEEALLIHEFLKEGSEILAERLLVRIEEYKRFH